jgi:3,4-dehydroadipyl-CoA semialdehyde dehydrogenase
MGGTEPSNLFGDFSMNTTASTNKSVPVTVLKSYLAGSWQSGAGEGTTLVNPSTGEPLASASANGLDLEKGFQYARKVGGPGLRSMGYSQRAELLGKVADVLARQRERWFQIARENSGNTKADAAIDVDGSIGTLKYFARAAAKLGNGNTLAGGVPSRLARDANFQGMHIGVPVDGLALHINAFNFPGWGLWEKAAVSLLAGVPVVSKPATATCWLAQEMVAAVINAAILPEGSLSILCGTPPDLLDYLRFGDVVAFTGSASTAESIRQHARVREQGIRVNVEADSLNAAVLGPDVTTDSAILNFFVREVVREMTSKAGQKCTAIRRILVPADRVNQVEDALNASLAKIAIGNPSNESVDMGPLVNSTQRKDVEDGIRVLSREAAISYRRATFRPVDADANSGAFVPPTLMRVGENSGDLVHRLEIFGPAATIVPYNGAENAFSIARRAGGSLAASVFSDDSNFLAASATQLGASHGRVLLVDSSIGDSHTGHGIVLPSLLHGGPGRAGGGEELGGLHGLWFYHQRLAVQGSGSTLAAIAGHAVNPSQS